MLLIIDHLQNPFPFSLGFYACQIPFLCWQTCILELLKNFLKYYELGIQEQPYPSELQF